MKKKFFSKISPRGYAIKYSLIILLTISFSFGIITKSKADIRFHTKKDYITTFLNTDLTNSGFTGTINDKTKDELNDNTVFYDQKDGFFSYVGQEKMNANLSAILPYFIKTSLSKDMVNFYQIKNNDINRATADIKKTLTSSSTPIDQEFVAKLLTIYIASKAFFNSSAPDALSYYTNIYNSFKNEDDRHDYYSAYGTATNNNGSGLDNVYSSVDGSDSLNIVQSTLVREWRLYLYKAINKLKDDYANKNVSKSVLDKVGDNSSGILSNIYDPKGTNRANQSLESSEIDNNQVTVGGVTTPLKIQIDQSTGLITPITDPNGNIQQDLSQINKCPPDLPLLRVFGDDIITNSHCSIVAYLINKLLDVINSIFGAILKLAVALFNWTIRFGIENFSNLVKGSGAFIIYQQVILALIVSLILPFVFYLILRALIDNDMDKIKKILPKLIFTALFVYFSFTISGFLIDQANVFSLKIASTLNSSDVPLGTNIQSLILRDSSGNDKGLTQAPDIAPGEPTNIPVYLVQVLITGSAILVFFQAGVLIFSRALILLLCLIFSPIMLLPEGIHSKIDEYRKKLTDYFTNNLLLAPIFLFLTMIALKIGEVGQNLIGGSGLNGVGNFSSDILAGAITGIISMVLLMLAVAIAKKMSTEIGTKISGKISSFTGNLAFGESSKLLKGVTNTIANNERFKGWVAKGGATSRRAYNLVNSMQGSTFDLRNNKTFQKASGGSFGRGTNLSARDTYNRKYQKEKDYHDLLTDEGKEKHLNRLQYTFNDRAIARDLQNKKTLTLADSLRSNQKQNDNFDKANSETDKAKREAKIKKEIDKHFKNNGKGDKYFSQELTKPENAQLLAKFKNANNETDEAKRKDEFLKVVKEFEDTLKKQKTPPPIYSMPPPPVSKTPPPIYSMPPPPVSKTPPPINNGPAPSVKDENAQRALKFKLKNNQLEKEADIFAKALSKNLTPILSSLKESVDKSSKKETPVVNIENETNKNNAA